MVVAAFDVAGYRPRDEHVAVMHADVGFQVLRLSLREDVTMFLVTLRDNSDVRTLSRPCSASQFRTRSISDDGVPWRGSHGCSSLSP